MNLFLARWKGYFEVNAALPDGLPESAPDAGIPEHPALSALLPALRATAGRDRRRLAEAATEFGAERGWDALGGLFSAILREEGRLADALGRFQSGDEPSGGPSSRSRDLQEDWTPGPAIGFQLVKLLPGWVSETLISLVAYRTFAEAARTDGLRALFRRALADRTAHAAFGAALLDAIRKSGPRDKADALRSAHRFLHSAMAPVFFLAHRDGLRLGGHGLWSFQEACRDVFERAFDPESLRSPAVPEPGSWVEDEGPGVRLRWEVIGREAGR
jgi:hypothetical protein